eukprot:gnl/Dysnectes_brevis/4855_a6726_503.p2 GENE.gnl/Dysnectes_brevis/4855_a6726_503~~gnl/Dysnectes_brevis/4855_a6726_503.p2  ORF type:complete len:116 (-),score=0.03 gnl/Dysnectes_brevis/4855_a6726_503:233-580(-)
MHWRRDHDDEAAAIHRFFVRVIDTIDRSDGTKAYIAAKAGFQSLLKLGTIAVVLNTRKCMIGKVCITNHHSVSVNNLNSKPSAGLSKVTNVVVHIHSGSKQTAIFTDFIDNIRHQ